ncbi:MAG: MBL fold metallo-hydrolase [Holosporaceae bacterium]|nr:MBL fold metallo-hydrolase [Holosporaceae bacterium]
MERSASADSITVNQNIEQRLRGSHAFGADFSFAKVGVDHSDGALYAHAFNVGQANFIVLRKKNKAVMIDAGYQSEEFKPSETLLDEVLPAPGDDGDDKVTPIEIEAVFITHPHKDHFSFFIGESNLFAVLGESFHETHFYLGGDLDDWQRTDFLKSLVGIYNSEDAESDCRIWLLDENGGKNRVTFLGNQHAAVSLLEGVSFRVFGTLPLSVHRIGKENKLSLLIQASFGGKNMLFLGDSEGDSLSRFYRKSMDIFPAIYLFPELKDNFTWEMLSAKLHEKVTQYSLNEVIADVGDFTNTYWESYCLLNEDVRCFPDIFDLIGEAIAEECPEAYHDAFISNLEDFLKLIFSNNAYSILCKEFAKEAMEHVNNVISTSSSEDQKSYAQMLLNEDILPGEAAVWQVIDQKIKGKEFDWCIGFFGHFINDIIQKAYENPVFLPNTRAALFSILARKENTQKKYYSLLTNRLVRTLAMRGLFKDSQIVFLPHHGTNTNNSQSFLGLFAPIDKPHIFIVSSSPFGRDQLPKASTLEMAPPYPQHPPHWFLYSRDFLESRGQPQLKLTMKPIYLTGAAPVGVITTMIRNDGKAFILDLIPREDHSLYGWIDISTGKRLPILQSDSQ